MEKHQGVNNDVLNTGSSSSLKNGGRSCQQLDVSLQQKYMVQSLFARVNHFCLSYMCVTEAVHVFSDKVAGVGCAD